MALESSQSGNRLFIIIAVALIGLICIGLMGLGAALFVIQSNRAQEEAALQPTATATAFPPTLTPTPTPTFTPTDTPEPTPTSTPVLQTAEPTPTEAGGDMSAQGEASPAPEITETVAVSSTGTSEPAPEVTATPAEVPNSGGVLQQSSGGILIWAGAILLLLLLIYGTIYWRRKSI